VGETSLVAVLKCARTNLKVGAIIMINNLL